MEKKHHKIKLLITLKKKIKIYLLMYFLIIKKLINILLIVYELMLFYCYQYVCYKS
jgi:hypothetical protein